MGSAEKLQRRLATAVKEKSELQTRYHRLRRLYVKRIGLPPLWNQREIALEIYRAALVAMANASGVGAPVWF